MGDEAGSARRWISTFRSPFRSPPRWLDLPASAPLGESSAGPAHSDVLDADASSTQPSLTPRTRQAFVTCMDTRVDVARLFGNLGPADAHVFRNAGGVVTDDTIRSLAVSQLIGQTDKILVIQHTDCALATTTDAAFARQLEEQTGLRPSWELGAFTSPDDAVRRSVARLRASPFLPHRGSIRGFVYDVHSGRLREISDLGPGITDSAPGQALWGGWWQAPDHEASIELSGSLLGGG